MRLPLSLILLFLSSVSFAQSTQDTVKYYLDYLWRKCEPEKAHFYRTAYKEDGFWHLKDFYLEEQTLQSEGKFSDPKFDTGQGMHYWYHSNGKLSEKVRYINGKRDGLRKAYAPDGRILDSTYYKNDTPYNALHNWYVNGQLMTRGIFDERDSGAGKQTGYYPDGKINYQGQYAKGHLADSIWTYYYKTGEVCNKVYYRNGKQEKQECFSAKGKMEKCKNYGPQLFGNRWVQDEIAKFHGYLREIYLTKVYEDDLGLRLCIEENGKITNVKIVHKFLPEIDSAIVKTFSGIYTKPGYAHNRPIKICVDLLFTFEHSYSGLKVKEKRYGNEYRETFSCPCDEP